MTNIETLTSLFRGSRKLTAVCAFAIAIAAAVSAQTNTFPASGNAGVGTTSPTHKLQVSGNGGTAGDSVLVTDSNTTTTAIDIANTSSGAKKWRLQSVGSSISGRIGNFEFVEVGSDLKALVIQPAGNVGIGTTSPSQKLNVIGNGLFGNITTRTQLYSTFDSQQNPFLEVGYDTPHSNITPFPVLTLSNNTTSTNNSEAAIGLIAFANRSIADNNDKRTALISGWVDGASNSGTLQFYTANAGTIGERLRITPAGNVGIGTTNPGAKFHLSAGDSSFALFGPNTTWGGSLAVGSGAAFVSPISGRAQVLSSNGNLHLDGGTNQSVYIGWLTPTTTIINGQGGSVGIGMSTPNYKLDVNGEINATGLRINGTPISSGGSSQWSGTSGNPIYYNGGSVGIGTTAPSDGLQIDSPTGWALRLRYTGTGHYLRMSSNQVSAYTPAGVGSDLFLNVDGGKVGIGTTNAQSNLQIGTQAPGATGTPVTLSLGGSFSNSAGANLKLKLYDDGNVGNTYGIGVSSGSMDFGVHSSAGYKWYAGGVNKMTLTSTGDLSVSGTIAAKYQDVAEWVLSAEQLSSGTVVVLDTTKSNQVVSSTTGYDTRVAGVISAQPGITLGESGEGKVLVATTGRVRVKVDASRGPIQIGDLLVTSDITGVAMKSEPVEFAGRKMHMPGTIIGKALEPMAKGRGEILVLLSLQ